MSFCKFAAITTISRLSTRPAPTNSVAIPSAESLPTANSKRMSLSSRLVLRIRRTRLTGGESSWSTSVRCEAVASDSSEASSRSLSEESTSSRRFMGLSSSSESLNCFPLALPLSSSSLDHTHSPVRVRWRRPEVPGCRLAALMTRVSMDGPLARSVCVRYFLSLAFLKNGCFSNSLAVGRFDGSFCRHSTIIFRKVFP
uniref:Putative activin types 1 and 2 receptor protein n=1 Tax=Lutzomyia longipalpis TaxID=7200 RepID=A0A7G3ACY9_LUTLO